MLTAQLKLEYENGYDAGLKQQGAFQLGYNDGLEAGREIANKMHQDGYEKGLKAFRTFDDKEKTVYYHVNEILKYLGVEDTRVANAFKGYFMAEEKLVNE